MILYSKPEGYSGARRRLQNKVVLITGVGSGHEREAALFFAREGAYVVGCDLNSRNAE
ncbi:hypothetical protein [Pseudomonas aeruginosa]|uniref:hypothetical protein n=1 Tax=Pseudomonas aeruginosa TaxID=287 RepID=UPI00163C82E3|nr:hypothetical protein [Pseudomonas aeruginosa]